MPRRHKQGATALKKLINRVDDILAQSLRGFGAAHADIVRCHEQPSFVTRTAPTRAGKVALISGGGSGHEPLHAGLVGVGMLDAACPGQVFTSPTPDQMLAAAQAVDGGAGVLFIVKNYEGDVMNFEMAAEMHAGAQATLIVNDDVAVEDSLFTTGRRGVAGTVIVEKMVGAAAEQGADLDTLLALGQRVNGRTRSMGVALTAPQGWRYGDRVTTIARDLHVGRGLHDPQGRFVTSRIEAVLRRRLPQPPDLFFTELSLIREDWATAGGRPTPVQFSDVFRMLPLGFGPGFAPGSPIVAFWITPKELEGLVDVMELQRSLGRRGAMVYSDTLDYRVRWWGIPFVNRVTGLTLHGKPFEQWPPLVQVATTAYVAAYIPRLGAMTHGLARVEMKDRDGRPITCAGVRPSRRVSSRTPRCNCAPMWASVSFRKRSSPCGSTRVHDRLPMVRPAPMKKSLESSLTSRSMYCRCAGRFEAMRISVSRLMKCAWGSTSWRSRVLPLKSPFMTPSLMKKMHLRTRTRATIL